MVREFVNLGARKGSFHLFRRINSYDFDLILQPLTNNKRN